MTTDMSKYERLLGTTLRVRCIVEADPPPTFITWKRLSLPSPASNFLSQDVRNDPIFGTLNKTAKMEDNGLWSCLAENGVHKLEGEFTVVILGKSRKLYR